MVLHFTIPPYLGSPHSASYPGFCFKSSIVPYSRSTTGIAVAVGIGAEVGVGAPESALAAGTGVAVGAGFAVAVGGTGVGSSPAHAIAKVRTASATSDKVPVFSNFNRILLLSVSLCVYPIFEM
ncbi:MAG: hypothetical protein FI727_04810 [SAR202 cluster bacterium]|nr:hypothetical protein [SAR202 cluster bacterium]